MNYTPDERDQKLWDEYEKVKAYIPASELNLIGDAD